MLRSRREEILEKELKKCQKIPSRIGSESWVNVPKSIDSSSLANATPGDELLMMRNVRQLLGKKNIKG